MVERVIKITADTAQAEANMQALAQDTESVNDAAEETNDTMSDMSKGAWENAKNFKVMGVSINSVSKGLKVLKVNLIATGIGAIAVLVGTLASAFLSTEEGMDKVNKILKPLTETMETAWGILQELGNGLMEIFSGDVEQGWNRMADAVENVGDKMEEAWERGKKLHELQMDIRGLESVEDLTVARLEKQVALNKIIAEDRSASFKDRMQATNQIIANEEAIANVRQQTFNKRLEQARLEMIANETDTEAKKEYNQLLAESIRLETRAIERSKSAFVKRQALQAEYTKGLTGESREPVSPITGQTVSETELVLSDETEAIQKEMQARLDGQKIAAQKEIELQKAIANADQLQKESMIRAAESLGSALMQLAGDNKALAIAGLLISQGSAVADSLISFSKANIGALAASRLLPPIASEAYLAKSLLTNKILLGTSLGGIALATGQGIANISQAGAGTIKGGSSSGGSSASGGGGASAPAPPSFNLVQGTGTNQIQETIDGANDKPTRAFVVSSDMTSQQQLDNNIKENANL